MFLNESTTVVELLHAEYLIKNTTDHLKIEGFTCDLLSYL